MSLQWRDCFHFSPGFECQWDKKLHKHYDLAFHFNLNVCQKFSFFYCIINLHFKFIWMQPATF